MKYDLILAGVGGQGILSIAFIIDRAALLQGLNFKQTEVHGMAQRGGAVQSHLRLADGPIYSDLIPRGKCDLILSVEPLEALRYLEYLDSQGRVITNSVPYVNIPDYPPLEAILEAIKKVKFHLLVEADKLAREAGSSRAQNMVMLGAASPFLPLESENLKRALKEFFESRDEKMVALNLRAFELGRQVALKQSWE
ncbi:MAG: indolepyruvate oxidoreductase subunit beta [Candidatus Aminicenantes bacterium]|nr:indolepyruvate oxidoreductase subunit beta [Candidatus Aminicenantes bacterium]